MNGLIQLLEYKNEWKVYYTPFSTLLQPHFKYSNRLDKLKIIEAMDRRLSSVDDEENGFIVWNHFKTIIEQELKIKEKILNDFTGNLTVN